MKKSESPQQVAFLLQSISTEQFAILEEDIKASDGLELTTNLTFGIQPNEHLIGVFSKFTFSQNGKPLMLIEIGCHFLIKPEHWLKMESKEGTVLVPKSVVSHMAIITIGTARGVLHAKTEGKAHNEFVLPTINVSELINKDVEITAESK